MTSTIPEQSQFIHRHRRSPEFELPKESHFKHRTSQATPQVDHNHHSPFDRLANWGLVWVPWLGTPG